MQLLNLAAFSASSPNMTLVVYGASITDNGNTHQFTGGAWPVPPSAGPFSNGPTVFSYVAETLEYALDDRSFGGATIDSRVIPCVSRPCTRQ